jgi:hypothetical protein
MVLKGSADDHKEQFGSGFGRGYIDPLWSDH